MLALGTQLPHFSLPDYDGTMVTPDQFADAPALLVAFICPHCPFVRHIRMGFGEFTREYQAKGLAVVGINSNDTDGFPEDGPNGMRDEARMAGYEFPYLFDESQQIRISEFDPGAGRFVEGSATLQDLVNRSRVPGGTIDVFEAVDRKSTRLNSSHS